MSWSSSSWEKRPCTSSTPTLFQFYQTSCIVSPELEVQVDNNHLVQVSQESVVKRWNEEKVKLESIEPWHEHEDDTWFHVRKVSFSSRIRLPNHYSLVDWPMCQAHFFFVKFTFSSGFILVHAPRILGSWYPRISKSWITRIYESLDIRIFGSQNPRLSGSQNPT